MRARFVTNDDFLAQLSFEIAFIENQLMSKRLMCKEDEEKFHFYSVTAKKIIAEVQTNMITEVCELYGEFLRTVKRFKRRVDNAAKFTERDIESFRKRYEQTGRPFIPLIHDIKMNVLERTAKLDMSKQLRNVNFSMHLYTNKELCEFAFKILDYHGTYQAETNLTPDNIKALIKTMCLRYNVVPYHNWTHAFSVFQMMFCLYEQSPSLQSFITPFEFFCSQLASLGHDLNHKGVGNLYKQKRNAACSRNYCEQGVLEGMHAAQLFQIMQGDSATGTPNIFSAVKVQSNVAALKLITVSCVIGTDMGQHSKQLAKMQKKVAATIKVRCSANPESLMEQQADLLSKESFEDRRFILKQLVHACDIGNPCLDFNNYLNWSYLISQEFSDQTLKEAKYNLPVTSFLQYKDRTTFINGQLFFLKVLVLPLWKEIGMLYPELITLSDAIIQNLSQLEVMKNRGIKKSKIDVSMKCES